jgi:hypothetical protein
MESGAPPIEEPYSVMISIPVASSNKGPSMSNAAVNPPDVTTRIERTPSSAAASTTSIEGCPQAADSIAIRAIEERKLFIDPASGMKPN